MMLLAAPLLLAAVQALLHVTCTMAFRSRACPPLANSRTNDWTVVRPVNRTAVPHGETIEATLLVACAKGRSARDGKKIVIAKVACRDGLWSPISFECVSNDMLGSGIKCDALDPSPHIFDIRVLRKGNATEWGVGWEVEYKCKNNSMYLGDKKTATIKCRSNGKWSKDPSSLKCHETSQMPDKNKKPFGHNCGSLKRFSKLGFSTLKMVNNSHAFMKCTESHHVAPRELSGNPEKITQITYVKCEEKSGHWVSSVEGKDLSDLQCIRTLCDNSSLVQTEFEVTRACGNVSEPNAVGDCVRYRCSDRDYHVNGTRMGTATIHCLPNGQWSHNPALLRCVRTILCSPLDLVRRPQLIINSSCPNAERRYGPGYCENYACKNKQLYVNGRNNFTIHCLANGTWSQDPSRLHCRACGLLKHDFMTSRTAHIDYSWNATHLRVECAANHHVLPLDIPHGLPTYFYLKCVDGEWTSPYNGIRQESLGCFKTKCNSKSLHRSDMTMQRNCPSNQSRNYGEECVLTYRCRNGGFFFNGEKYVNIRCLSTGEWSQDVAKLQCLTCAPISRFFMGAPRIDYTLNGTHALVECPITHHVIPKVLYHINPRSFYFECIKGEWEFPYKEILHSMPDCDKTTCDNTNLTNNAWTLGQPTCPDGSSSYGVDCSLTIRCRYAKYFSNGLQTKKITCLPNGEWNQDPTRLYCRKCGKISMLNGSPYIDYGFNETHAMVTCPETHRLVANLPHQEKTAVARTFYLQCTSDHWASPYIGINTHDLNCQQLFCDPPIVDGFVTANCSNHEPPRNTVGYCFKFGCPNGYRLNENATTSVRCLSNGKWNNKPTNFQCQPKNPCAVPENFPYNVGITSIHEYPQGSGFLSKIVWGCREGFRSLSNTSEHSSVQHCNTELGEWSPPIEPTKLRDNCRPVNLCESGIFNDIARKKMIAKGACDFADVYTPGHCVDIRCIHRDYLIDGNQTYTLRCQADGNWSKNVTTLQCEPKKSCSHPLPSHIPSNVERIPRKTSRPKPLAKLVWRCARGFRPERGAWRFVQTCNAEEGKWEPSIEMMPTCLPRKKAPKCSYPPRVSQYPVNALLLQTRSNESLLVWQCEGREDEFATQTCNAKTGVWEPTTFTKTCKKKCDDVPPLSPNVVMTPSRSTFHAGDVVTFKCNNDTAAYTFRSRGANRLICDKNGKWNFTEHTAYNCHKVFAYCRVHESFFAAPSGFVNSGTTVRLKPCPRGHYRLGPNEVVCTSTTYFNEPWSNIKCQKKTCGKPVVAPDCEFVHKLQESGHSYEWKTILPYFHKTEGWRGRLICMSDGKWNYKRTECDPNKRAPAAG